MEEEEHLTQLPLSIVASHFFLSLYCMALMTLMQLHLAALASSNGSHTTSIYSVNGGGQPSSFPSRYSLT